MLNHPSFYPNHLADIGVPSSGINFHYAILSSFATGRRSFQSSVGTFRRDKSVRKAAGAIHQNPSTLFRYLCLAVHMIVCLRATPKKLKKSPYVSSKLARDKATASDS